jgi:D-alanyl-D-alanine carboxypeptidase
MTSIGIGIWVPAHRQLISIVSAAGIALLAGCGESRAPSDSNRSATAEAPAWAAELDKRIPAALQESELPGAIVGVWQGDKLLYLKAFGVADTATNAPMRTDFHVRIGSLTKAYTVMGLLQLAKDGKLSLDDPISKYVSDVPNGDAITLRQLASMRSGLGDYSEVVTPNLYKDPEKLWTPKELLELTLKQPQRFEPNAEFDYNNSNTVLLGLVVEKVSGLPLDRYIKERILDPLGLRNTSLPMTNALPDPHPHGYGDWNPKQEVEDVTSWSPTWGWAAGGMVSNAQDIARWTRALAKGELLTPELQRERETALPAPTEGGGAKYGLAYEIHPGGWQGHNGRIPGWTTYPYYLPAKDLTIVTLINSSANVVQSWGLFDTVVKTVTPDHPWSKLPDPD